MRKVELMVFEWVELKAEQKDEMKAGLMVVATAAVMAAW